MKSIKNRISIGKKGLVKTGPLFAKVRASESGQALVEYIFIVFLMLFVFLGAFYQVSSAFQNWAGQYFGNYLTCLLETGELPSLGYSQETTSLTGCDAEYAPFSIANGRPPLFGAGAGGSGEGGDGAGAGSGAGSGGVVQGGRFGRSGGGRGRGVGRSGKFRGKAKKGASSKGKNKDKAFQNKFISSSTSTSVAQEIDDGDDVYLVRYGAAQKEKEKKKESSQRVFTKKGRLSGGESSKDKVFVVKKAPKRELQQEEKRLTLPGFLRYLVLILLVVGLVIFLFLQMSQLRKTME